MKTITISTQKDTHKSVEVLLKGNTESPKRALILFHGRGSSADNIIVLSDSISLPDDVVVLAPQADGRQWYPQRFIEERAHNEPELSSAIGMVNVLFSHCLKKYNLSSEDIVLAGFSQGGCLAADYAARTPQRYHGIAVFSGGLIGSDREIQEAEWIGDMKQAPVYIGCDKTDSHIPLARVKSTAEIYAKMNSQVEIHVYEGLGHAIHPDGLIFLTELFTQKNRI